MEENEFLVLQYIATEKGVRYYVSIYVKIGEIFSFQTSLMLALTITLKKEEASTDVPNTQKTVLLR